MCAINRCFQRQMQSNLSQATEPPALSHCSPQRLPMSAQSSNPIADAARSWLSEVREFLWIVAATCMRLTPPVLARQALCCTRRKGSSTERREYDNLREALARKQEEVRRLQEQCAALEARPSAGAGAAPSPVAVMPIDQEAAIRIQAIHRGHLARAPLIGGTESLEESAPPAAPE